MPTTRTTRAVRDGHQLFPLIVTVPTMVSISLTRLWAAVSVSTMLSVMVTSSPT